MEGSWMVPASRVGRTAPENSAVQPSAAVHPQIANPISLLVPCSESQLSNLSLCESSRRLREPLLAHDAH